MAKFPVNVAQFLAEAGDPAATLSSGQVYTKLVAGVVQLFYETDLGVVYQITPSGLARGNGSPEGAVIGSVGDLWSQLDAVGGPAMWVKRTGAATNTGWSAVIGMVAQIGADAGMYFLGMSATGVIPTGRFNGSNAGVQYSADVANRAQFRGNQYGANTAGAGITTFKSRGAFGADAPVAPGDLLGRWTAIGVSDNLSINLAALLSFYADSVPAASAWVPTRMELELVDNALARRLAVKVTPDGELSARGPIGPGDGSPTGATTGPRWRTGVGSPEGVVTGSPGDLYSNTAGGAGTTEYVKESGVATNTGWIGVAAYTPAVPGDWSPVPTTVSGALDQLALTNAPEPFSAPMLPAVPVIAQATRALPAASLFEGGIYTCTKRITLANLQMRATAAAVGAMLRLAVYQRSNGTLGGALPLLFSAVVAVPVGNFVVPVPPGTILTEGQYVVLVGRAVAAFAQTIRVWSVPALEMFTSVVPVGKAPYAFTTVISSLVAPPATFDPLVSGVATATNVCPMMIGGS